MYKVPIYECVVNLIGERSWHLEMVNVTVKSKPVIQCIGQVLSADVVT